MSLIRISHALEDSELLAGFGDLPLEEVGAILAQADPLAMLIGAAETPPMVVERAVSTEGDEYENVHFIVNTRYMENGDVYLAGGVFSFNYSEYLRDLKSAFDEAFKQAEVFKQP